MTQHGPGADVIRTLYDYSYWAHRQVWACIAQLTDAQFARDFDWSHGSIHAQVVHTMGAEWIWFERLRGGWPRAMLAPADYPTRDAVRARWDEIEADVRAYLATLDDAQLVENVHYRSTKGDAHVNVMWEILLHVVNHGTDHRAQIMAALNQMGAPTVEQDFIFFLRARGGGS